jgi:hypothetical protein
MTMTLPEQRQNWISRAQVCARAIALGIVLTVVALAAHAQTFTVLHNFTDQNDGGSPAAGMTVDSHGTFYGTTEYGGDLSCDGGGPPGCGVLFKFKNTGSGWVLTPIHAFNDSQFPTYPGVPAVGSDGNLYDVTFLGGTYSSGRVFTVIPLPFGRWAYKVLYQFTGGSDGGCPTTLAPVLFDSAGNIYGAATCGGPTNSGVVYKLTRSNTGWKESVLYSFTGGNDGSNPHGITFDAAGNIYGVAADGGGNQNCGFNKGCGTIYKLTPSPSGWTETTLHTFQQGVDGGHSGPLIRDKAGNLYGITEQYGPNNNGGTVWELSPSNGGWTLSVLYAFPTATVDDYGPYALTMDTAGNLYGISNEGGLYSRGFLFKLAPSNGGWTYTDLHDFGGEGCYPQGAVLLDTAGNLYGGTQFCGTYGYGVLWKFTP